jgi:TP901 family phage tail tape measure protein
MATSVAQLLVAITADTKGLNAGLASATKSTSAFGATASALGTAAVVGIAAAGAAAVKLGYDFDKSFTRIAAISNTSAGAIEGMKDQVLTLAGETAQSPVELADALFFLASAGLDATQVMPALEASAKASAVGLGETADVANIVASALNAYSDSSLTASKATDVLVAAVREGRAEPDEFANALGRILPIASKVGVTFDQVAASMAALSNIGLDVNEGVTAMRGVLQALAAPGAQAANAMASVGLSAQDLLDAISEQGIVGALRMLDKAVKAQTTTDAEYNDTMRKIIPNVRALTGVFGLTVQEAEKVDAIFRKVLDSTGATGEAFRTTAESDAFRLQKALNDLVVIGTRIGSDILPILASALKFVADNAKLLGTAFLSWLIVTKGIPLVLTAVRVAAMGVATVFPVLSQAMINVGVAANIARIAVAALSAALTLGLSVGLLIIPGLIANFNISLEKMAKETGFTTDYLSDLDSQLALTNNWFTRVSFSGFLTMLNGTRDEVQKLTQSLGPLFMQLQDMGLSASQAEGFLRSFTANMREATDPAIAEVTERVKDQITLIDALGESLGQKEIDIGIFTDRMVMLGFSTAEATALADAALDRFGRSVDSTGKIVKNFANLTDEEFAKFKQDVVESLQVTAGQFESLKDAFDTTPRELQKQLNLAIQIARRSQRAIRTIFASNTLNTAQKEALAELPANMRDAWLQAGEAGRRQIARDAVTLKRANEQGAERAVSKVGDIINKAIPEKADPVEITVDAMTANRTISAVESRLRGIPDEDVVIHVKTEGSPSGFWVIDQLEARLHDVTEPSWEVPIRVSAPALDSLDGFGGAGMAGAGAAPGGGGNLAVVLDRRKFTETTDHDARYRGF